MVRTDTYLRQESTPDSRRDTHRNWLKPSTNVGNCFVHQADVPRHLFYADDIPPGPLRLRLVLILPTSKFNGVCASTRRHMHSCSISRQILDHNGADDWGAVDCADAGPAARAPDSCRHNGQIHHSSALDTVSRVDAGPAAHAPVATARMQ